MKVVSLSIYKEGKVSMHEHGAQMHLWVIGFKLCHLFPAYKTVWTEMLGRIALKTRFHCGELEDRRYFFKDRIVSRSSGPLVNVCFVLTQCGHFCGVWNFFGWSSLFLTTLSWSLSLKTSRHCEEWGWVKVRHAVVCIRVWKTSESANIWTHACMFMSDSSCFTNTHADIFNEILL